MVCTAFVYGCLHSCTQSAYSLLSPGEHHGGVEAFLELVAAVVASGRAGSRGIGCRLRFSIRCLEGQSSSAVCLWGGWDAFLTVVLCLRGDLDGLCLKYFEELGGDGLVGIPRSKDGCFVLHLLRSIISFI